MKKSKFTEQQIAFALHQAEGRHPSRGSLPQARHQPGNVLPMEEDLRRADDEYCNAGAKIVDTPQEIFARAEMVVKVKEPLDGERKMLRPGIRATAQNRINFPIYVT